MLLKFVHAVAHVSGLPGPQKSVLLHLATFCNEPDGGGIYPSVDLLVALTGYKRREIYIVLGKLASAGWLIAEVTRREHVKGWKLNLTMLGVNAPVITKRATPRILVGEEAPPIPYEEEVSMYASQEESTPGTCLLYTSDAADE